jgi:hypothetical protein
MEAHGGTIKNLMSSLIILVGGNMFVGADSDYIKNFKLFPLMMTELLAVIRESVF